MDRPWRTALAFVCAAALLLAVGAVPVGSAVPSSLRMVPVATAEERAATWARVWQKPGTTLADHEARMAHADQAVPEESPADGTADASTDAAEAVSDEDVALSMHDNSPEGQPGPRHLDDAMGAAVVVDRSAVLQLGAQKDKKQRAQLKRQADQLKAPGVDVVDGAKLSSFFATLDAAVGEANPTDAARANVVVLGNSLIASDHVVDVVRARLQHTFGNGGRGLLLPERLSSTAGRRVRTGTGSNTWNIHTLITQADGATTPPLGLTGSAHEANADLSSIYWNIEGDTDATLWWRSGGAFSLWQGEDQLASASAETQREGRMRRLAVRGTAPVVVKAQQGTTLYGLVLENKQPGVVVDTIGVPAASARLYDVGVDPALFSAQLRERAPSMVMLMLGGNEARGIAYGKITAEQFEAHLRALVQRIHDVTPSANCLMVTPIDAVKANTAGDVLSSRPELTQVVDVQKRVAQDMGCAFLDLFAAMGGAGSLVRFQQAGLLSADLVHPTGRGGDVLGHLLSDALLRAYGTTASDAAAVIHRRSERAGGDARAAGHNNLVALRYPTIDEARTVELNNLPTTAAPPRALEKFYRALQVLERGDDDVEGAGRVAILQMGASHTAGQSLTDHMRERLAEKFGSAGRGMVAAGPANKRLLPSGVTRTIDGKYDIADGREVLHGGTVGVSGTKTRLSPGAVFRVGFCQGCQSQKPATIQLSWLYTPDMGTADIVVDGKVLATIDGVHRTTSTDVQLSSVAVDNEQAVVEVRNREADAEAVGPVHLLSVSSETGARGVVLDAMGLPGTTGMTPQRWRQELMREEVRARDYRLVITAWGTNEAGIRRLDEATYRHHFGATLKSLLEASPRADCLIMGASDRMDMVDGSWRAAPNHAMVERVQQALAAEHGCAFFSLRTAMGGEGSMKKWVSDKRALDDHVHFTRDGYRVLADLFIDDILQDYADWKLRSLSSVAPPGPPGDAATSPMNQEQDDIHAVP
jgi:lysophospholipase L1-like esterase